MENNTMKITQNEAKKILEITIKNNKMNTQDVYCSIVTILEWTEKMHGVNAQLIADSFKKRNFVREHYYNPVL